MKEAVSKMKAELGDDAVILHTKKFKEGGILGYGSKEMVEITAAVEDEKPAPKAEPERPAISLNPPSVLSQYKTNGTPEGLALAEESAQPQRLTNDEEIAKDEELEKPAKNFQSETVNEDVQDDKSSYNELQEQTENSPVEAEKPKLEVAEDQSISKENVTQSVPQQINNAPVQQPVTAVAAEQVEPTQPVNQLPQMNSEEKSVQSTSQNNNAVNPVQPQMPQVNSGVNPAQSVAQMPQSQVNSGVEPVQPPQINLGMNSIQPVTPVPQVNSEANFVPPVNQVPQANAAINQMQFSEQKFSENQTINPVQSVHHVNQQLENLQNQVQSQNINENHQETTQMQNQADSSQQMLSPNQLAQAQAIMLAQFNQFQMAQAMQQVMAQAQAQAQSQVAQAQVSQQMYQQPVQSSEVSDSEKQSQEKIRKLESEIAQMKALLAQVMGKAPNQTVTLHEALKLQEVDENILNDMAAQAGAGETLSDSNSRAAKLTLQNFLKQNLSFAQGIKLNRHGVRIVALLGTTGVGKTTTLAKIAAKFVLEQGITAALITADTYRISAVEQLRTYSDILGLPLEIVYSPMELSKAINKYRNRDLILIDTAGRSQHNDYQMKELQEFLQTNQRIEKHIVLSTTTKSSDANDILEKFSICEPDKVIFTKTDETASVGLIVNLLYKQKLSLSYLTNGQSVPDDIIPATEESLADLLLRKNT